MHSEREIKALKIQTVRWRQTHTLMTEIEGSNKLGLFYLSIRFGGKCHEQWSRELMLCRDIAFYNLCAYFSSFF